MKHLYIFHTLTTQSLDKYEKFAGKGFEPFSGQKKCKLLRGGN
ncbi:hypothetical protein [Trichormus variabilis]|nr:hypothetical protein [Trichormus variabilis]